MGVNKDIDYVKVLENIEAVHTRVPIADYFDIWDQSSRCHASQGGGRISKTSNWWRRLIYGYQNLTRVYPAPPRDKIDEYDDFANVTLD